MYYPARSPYMMTQPMVGPGLQQPMMQEQFSMPQRAGTGIFNGLSSAVGIGGLAFSLSPLSPTNMGITAGWNAAKAAGGILSGGGLMAGIGAALPGIAMGYAATKAIQYSINQMGQGAAMQANTANYLQNTYRYTSGRTMSNQDTLKVTQNLYSMSRELGTSVGNVAGMLRGFNSMGLLSAVSNVRQFNAQFRRLVMGAKQIAEELGTSMKNAAQVMTQMRSTGFRTLGDVKAVMPMINQVRWGTGLNTSQVLQLQQQGAALGHALGAQRWQGAVGAMNAATTISYAAHNQVLNPAAIEEAMGVSGPQAILQFSQLTQQILARKLMSRKGRYYLAAAADEDMRGLNSARLQALMSGVYTYDDIKKMARSRVYGAHGRGINAADRLLMHEEDMRGAILERGPMALAAMMRMEMGSDIWDTENWRVNRRVRRTYGVNKRQAELLLNMARRMPEMVETQMKEEERRSALQVTGKNVRLGAALKRYVNLWWKGNIKDPLQNAGAVVEAWVQDKMNSAVREMNEDLRRRLGLKVNRLREPNILSAGEGAIVLHGLRTGTFRPIAMPENTTMSPLMRTMAGLAGAPTLYGAAGFSSMSAMDQALSSSQYEKAWKSWIYSSGAAANRGSLIQAMTASAYAGPMAELFKGKTFTQRMAIVRSMGNRYGFGLAGGGKGLFERLFMSGTSSPWTPANVYTPSEAELEQVGMGASGKYWREESSPLLAGGRMTAADVESRVRSRARFLPRGQGIAGRAVALAGLYSEEYGKWYEGGGKEEIIAAGKSLLNSDAAKWAMNDQTIAPLLARAAGGDKDAEKELGFQLDRIIRTGKGPAAEHAREFSKEIFTNKAALHVAANMAKSKATEKWIKKVGNRLAGWEVSSTDRRLLRQAGLGDIVDNLRNPQQFLSASEHMMETLWNATPDQRAKALAAFRHGGKAAQPAGAMARGLVQVATTWEKYGAKTGTITSRKGILAMLGQLGITGAASVLKTKKGRELLKKAIAGDEGASEELTNMIGVGEDQKPLVQNLFTGGISKEEGFQVGRQAGFRLHTIGMSDWKANAMKKVADSRKFFGSLPGIHAELMKQTAELKKIAERGVDGDKKTEKSGNAPA